MMERVVMRDKTGRNNKSVIQRSDRKIGLDTEPIEIGSPGPIGEIGSSDPMGFRRLIGFDAFISNGFQGTSTVYNKDVYNEDVYNEELD